MAGSGLQKVKNDGRWECEGERREAQFARRVQQRTTANTPTVGHVGPRPPPPTHQATSSPNAAASATATGFRASSATKALARVR